MPATRDLDWRQKRVLLEASVRIGEPQYQLEWKLLGLIHVKSLQVYFNLSPAVSAEYRCGTVNHGPRMSLMSAETMSQAARQHLSLRFDVGFSDIR